MKEKILILEDEIGIRSFVSINLKREGYEVIEAGCGQEAIDKIKNEKNRKTSNHVSPAGICPDPRCGSIHIPLHCTRRRLGFL